MTACISEDGLRGGIVKSGKYTGPLSIGEHQFRECDVTWTEYEGRYIFKDGFRTHIVNNGYKWWDGAIVVNSGESVMPSIREPGPVTVTLGDGRTAQIHVRSYKPNIVRTDRIDNSVSLTSKVTIQLSGHGECFAEKGTE